MGARHSWDDPQHKHMSAEWILSPGHMLTHLWVPLELRWLQSAVRAGSVCSHLLPGSTSRAPAAVLPDPTHVSSPGNMHWPQALGVTG